MKMITVVALIVLFIAGPAYAGGYVKPDQWGGFNGRDDATGERVSAKPGSYGGFKVKKGGDTIDMKPDRYGGYRCTVYNRNYKKTGSYYLRPDGYGGYKSDDINIKVRKDRWGVYRW